MREEAAGVGQNQTRMANATSGPPGATDSVVQPGADERPGLSSSLSGLLRCIPLLLPEGSSSSLELLKIPQGTFCLVCPQRLPTMSPACPCPTGLLPHQVAFGLTSLPLSSLPSAFTPDASCILKKNSKKRKHKIVLTEVKITSIN